MFHCTNQSGNPHLLTMFALLAPPKVVNVWCFLLCLMQAEGMIVDRRAHLKDTHTTVLGYKIPLSHYIITSFQTKSCTTQSVETD